jgi:dATP pyrophosphohydrolase
VKTIPEYSFGIEVPSADLTLSREHITYAWLPLAAACEKLEWESNRSALQELHRRLTEV